ncbi:MAG: hypothetical protein Q7R33_09495 [Nitrosarchaeum sp.]|nr:hypothetical protein [Nitrosarchaeum sp.]
MIKREDIDWTIDNPLCFICRKTVKDIKCITFCENTNNKAALFKDRPELYFNRCYKSVKVCMSCWEISAGKDWTFSDD